MGLVIGLDPEHQPDPDYPVLEGSPEAAGFDLNAPIWCRWEWVGAVGTDMHLDHYPPYGITSEQVEDS
jgi:hypothetical protein